MKFLTFLACCFVSVLAVQESRIYNGLRAKQQNFPYHVEIIMNNRRVCGGALISKNHVLSAAHCFRRGVKLSARFGNNQTIKFSKVSIHKNYDSRTLANDIAIAYLEKPAKIDGTFVKFIKLSFEHIGVNKTVTVSGYGKTNNNKPSKDLQYANLSTKPANICKFMNDRIQMCVMDDSKKQALCQGDSGGPAIINKNNPVLVGIVSAGIPKPGNKDKCALNLGNILVRVSAFKTWITQQIKN